MIANTPRNRIAMIDAFDIPARKIEVIPDGFDPEDFAIASEAPTKPDRFDVTCLGNFYEMPDPTRFFRAVRRFTDQHPDVHLSLYGWQPRRVRAAAESLLRPGTWHRAETIPT